MIKCNRCKMQIKISTGIFNKKYNTPYQTFTLNKQRVDLCNGCADMIMHEIDNTKLTAVELLFRDK